MGNKRAQRRNILTVGAAVAAIGLVSFYFWSGAHSKRKAPNQREEVAQRPADGGSPDEVFYPTATYVGTDACAGCHQEQAKAHAGSHHDRAIEEPTAQTVLAPFAGETFNHDGVTTKFFREGDTFMIRTVGPDKKQKDYRVAYTFGFTPLQQYLLDMGEGRLQALTVAWDTREKEAGGQRYFDLYPHEKLTVNNELHWSRPSQNWNFACADCHTTGLKKGYDAQKDTFSPSWGELDVGCEACHGPGSNHLSWAKNASGKDGNSAVQDNNTAAFSSEMELVISLRRAPPWVIPGSARHASPRLMDDNIREVETCAPCHSRRQQLREGRTPDQPFLDAFVPELLGQGLYHADGQIQDEVYVYGSFVQSRMYHAGVRCSDCHDPHSQSLRREGNALCSGCHNSEVYNTQAHHHHEGKGSACVDCHMPETTYMQVDPRRDHSLRIPRPDMASTIGAPDACTNCHKNKSQEWAATRIFEWTGKKPPPHYGLIFQAARRAEPDVAARLIDLASDERQPAIVRGTAYLLLANYPGEATAQALRKGATSAEPMLRLGVTRGAFGLSLNDRIQVIYPLLSDPLLAIRTEAARVAVGVPSQAIAAEQRSQVEKALNELRVTENFYADRPDAWLRIALIELGRGQVDLAQQALEQALKLDPQFTPALVNLADLLRMQQKPEDAQVLLRRAVEIDEHNAEAWHALGLALVREQQLKEATVLLRRAAELRPENARFFYVYAVALAEQGELNGAIEVLRAGLTHQPNDRTLLQTLMTYAKQQGNRELASEAAARLAGLGNLLDQ